MKTLPFWKKSIYSALIFFGALITLTVGYAAWNTTMSKVTAGNPLTATAWNALVDNITDLDSRWARVGGNIAFTGGNVGIGTTNPGAKLEINGNIKISDGTQGIGKLLTSDANGLATWSDPSYQTIAISQPTGTIVNISNDQLLTGDVTLTQGVWLLNIGYWLNPSAISGCFDIYVDALPTSGTFTTIGLLPNFNSEQAYAAGRHGYLSNTQLINVTSATAAVHARRHGNWCSAASYTINQAILGMIATKVR
ncbi:MAG: hypothetical protein PHH16_02380 [Candidatus Gracilibacteria bacterium]|nr:hypothetical protein [Candidatus Gracilibacteria bacterium]